MSPQQNEERLKYVNIQNIYFAYERARPQGYTHRIEVQLFASGQTKQKAERLTTLLSLLISSLSSERDRCCCQRSVPDHVDCLSQKKTQTLQTAPQTNHGVPDKSQCCSGTEVGPESYLTLIDFIKDVISPKCNMGYCFSLGCSPLLVFLKDQASSHLIETIIQLSHKPLLRDLYKNHLKGHMVDLALHPIANFPIQRLTAASAKYKMVGNNCQALCDIVSDTLLFWTWT